MEHRASLCEECNMIVWLVIQPSDPEEVIMIETVPINALVVVGYQLNREPTLMGYSVKPEPEPIYGNRKIFKIHNCPEK